MSEFVRLAKEVSVRRSIGLLFLAASIAFPAHSSAAPVAADPGVVADEEAVASWMFPTDRPRHSKWFFAGAYRSATAGGRTITTGFAVTGWCEVEREPGEPTTTTCHGKGIGGRLRDRAFRVDPALREARLVLREGGTTHRLSWSADGYAPPSGYV
ncbi:MAG: hypothetical protein M3134_11835, partial [Actinomycetota bacterium]|nr:hypothetical protein [Actinomycetota bacterium]